MFINLVKNLDLLVSPSSSSLLPVSWPYPETFENISLRYTFYD